MSEEQFEIPKINESSDEIKKILKESSTIAVVGISQDESKPSFKVAKYLKSQGYKIIPVNPKYTEVLGEKCYPSLNDIPESIDIVDIFMRAENVPPIVDMAIQKKAKTVWMQEGIVNNSAAEIAKQNGLKVIMDRCIYKEHRKAQNLDAPLL